MDDRRCRQVLAFSLDEILLRRHLDTLEMRPPPPPPAARLRAVDADADADAGAALPAIGMRLGAVHERAGGGAKAVGGSPRPMPALHCKPLKWRVVEPGVTLCTHVAPMVNGADATSLVAHGAISVLRDASWGQAPPELAAMLTTQPPLGKPPPTKPPKVGHAANANGAAPMRPAAPAASKPKSPRVARRQRVASCADADGWTDTPVAAPVAASAAWNASAWKEEDNDRIETPLRARLAPW